MGFFSSSYPIHQHRNPNPTDDEELGINTVLPAADEGKGADGEEEEEEEQRGWV